ncbi:hypothetical protein HDU76_013318, partial [Blyttiomyces sp. JEL0837]
MNIKDNNTININDILPPHLLLHAFQYLQPLSPIDTHSPLPLPGDRMVHIPTTAKRCPKSPPNSKPSIPIELLLASTCRYWRRVVCQGMPFSSYFNLPAMLTAARLNRIGLTRAGLDPGILLFAGDVGRLKRLKGLDLCFPGISMGCLDLLLERLYQCYIGKGKGKGKEKEVMGEHVDDEGLKLESLILMFRMQEWTHTIEDGHPACVVEDVMNRFSEFFERLDVYDHEHGGAEEGTTSTTIDNNDTTMATIQPPQKSPNRKRPRIKFLRIHVSLAFHGDPPLISHKAVERFSKALGGSLETLQIRMSGPLGRNAGWSIRERPGLVLDLRWMTGAFGFGGGTTVNGNVPPDEIDDDWEEIGNDFVRVGDGVDDSGGEGVDDGDGEGEGDEVVGGNVNERENDGGGGGAGETMDPSPMEVVGHDVGENALSRVANDILEASAVLMNSLNVLDRVVTNATSSERGQEQSETTTNLTRSARAKRRPRRLRLNEHHPALILAAHNPNLQTLRMDAFPLDLSILRVLVGASIKILHIREVYHTVGTLSGFENLERLSLGVGNWLPNIGFAGYGGIHPLMLGFQGRSSLRSMRSPTGHETGSVNDLGMVAVSPSHPVRRVLNGLSVAARGRLVTLAIAGIHREALMEFFMGSVVLGLGEDGKSGSGRERERTVSVQGDGVNEDVAVQVDFDGVGEVIASGHAARSARLRRVRRERLGAVENGVTAGAVGAENEADGVIGDEALMDIVRELDEAFVDYGGAEQLPDGEGVDQVVEGFDAPDAPDDEVLPGEGQDGQQGHDISPTESEEAIQSILPGGSESRPTLITGSSPF